MLKRSRSRKPCGLFQFFYQLPAVQGIQEVNITGFAAQHLDREITSVLHVDAGRLLVWIASVFQLNFVHFFLLFLVIY